MMATGELDNDDSATSGAYAGMKVDDAERHKDLEREYRQLAVQLDHHAARTRRFAEQEQERVSKWSQETGDLPHC